MAKTNFKEYRRVRLTDAEFAAVRKAACKARIDAPTTDGGLLRAIVLDWCKGREARRG